MYVDKVKKLAKFLLTVPRDNFSMETFYENISGDSECFIKKMQKECNSVACAAGWATRVFPELSFNENGYVLNNKTERENFEAMEDCLQITEKFSQFLFDPSSYPRKEVKNPVYVSKRLTRLAEGRLTRKEKDTLENGGEWVF